MPNIEISDETHDALKRLADEAGMKMKALVERILRDGLRRPEMSITRWPKKAEVRRKA